MSAPLTVGLDGTVYGWTSPGGVARTYKEIMPRICELDHALTFDLFMDGPIAGGRPAAPGVRVRRCRQLHRCLRPRRLLGRFREAARSVSFGLSVRESSCDVWHATYFAVPTACRIPLVVSNYDMVFSLFPHLYARRREDAAFRRRQRRALLRADHVIVNSETTKADTVRLVDVDPERITAIPLACSSAFHQLPLDAGVPSSSPLAHVVAEGRPFVLYVGGRHPHKNFAGLATAFAHWKQDDFLLIIVGPRLDGRERDDLARLGILERVRLFSDLSDDDLAILYNKAGVFVYPSLYEGFGVPLVEAMACACPVVASRIPSSVEVAGGVAAFFDLEDPTSLVAAMERAVVRGREPLWVDAALARAATFSWDECARKTLDVYRQVTS